MDEHLGGHVPTYEELLDDLVSLQCQDQPPPEPQSAMDLVIENDVDGLRRFLRGHPEMNINERDPVTGRSLIHHASAEGQHEMVKILLQESDISLMLRTMLGGCTALHLAVTNNHRSIVFLLLSHGADPLMRDKFGCAPMHYVSSLSVAKLLVQYGGKVLDHNSKRKNALESVSARAKEIDDGSDPVGVDKLNDLRKYLKHQGEAEYRAKLSKLRNLKQQVRRQLNYQDLQRQRKATKEA